VVESRGVAVCCSMLQYVAVCCSMLQYVAVLLSYSSVNNGLHTTSLSTILEKVLQIHFRCILCIHIYIH